MVFGHAENPRGNGETPAMMGWNAATFPWVAPSPQRLKGVAMRALIMGAWGQPPWVDAKRQAWAGSRMVGDRAWRNTKIVKH
jgi:hypothetical protein